MTTAMRKLVRGVGLALAFAATAHAQGYSPTAQQVLARARTAAGGAGWNRLAGWHETGRENGVGYEIWLDPLRYGMRLETHEPAGLRVHGFNGGGDWQIAPGGAVTGLDVTKLVSDTRTEAFFRTYGYFYPGRFDARGEYLGVRNAQNRAFDVVEVKPWGGKPRELWFDRRTHLLGRMVDRSGASPVIVQLSDYRKAGPVRVAFRFTLQDTGQPAAAQERQVESLAFTPVDRTLFSLPRATKATVEEEPFAAGR